MDDRNRFNLKLSSLSLKEGVHRNPSITSQTQNEDEANELVNILPSYQMFRSTITKNLTPSVEDSRTAPPQYEMTPDLSTVRLHEYFASVPTSPSPNFEEQQQRQLGMGMPTPGDDQEGEEGDEVTDETILENAHKLKRLTSFNKDIAKQLEVKINITKHFGKLGEPYTLVDPLSLELKQGDYIYGFVLITNKTKHPIPFDMFSVQLEGCATFGKTTNSTLVEQPTHIDRFLTMFDFHASWNDAYLDRLISDHNDPHKPISVFDPIDNTHYHLDHRKIFEPGLTYKKYFTFKIPEKLLESVCDHSLIKHLQIPPTLGVSKNEMISSLRNKWKDQHDKTAEEGGASSKKYKYASLTNDFSFNDTSISYCISARVIGRASGYQQFFGTLGSHTIDETNDEYVVANEDYKYLRVMPVTKTIFELNRSMIHQEARLLYTNMVDKIKEKIALGKDILAARQQQNSLQPVSSGGSLRQLANTLSPQTSLSNLGGGLRPVSSEPSLANTSPPPLTPTSSTTDLIKMQQSYYSKVNQRNIHVQNENTYEVFFPYKKKSVFGHTKIIGLTAFSTPKKEYYVHYIPLPQFQPKQKPIPTILNIPIDLTFIYGDDRHQSSSSSSSLPEFKSLSVELVSLTVKSKKLPIPIVIHPEMMFENKTKNGGNSNDNFDILTIKKFQKYAIELSRLLKEVGPEALDVERDLVQDIKCLANLSTKYVHVNIRDVGISANGQSYDSIGAVPWQKEILKSTDNNSGKVQNTSKFYKNLQLSVNFANAVLKPINSTDFCLIPDFQSCLLARIYYLKIDLKFHTSTEKVTLRVPIVLQKS
ncbi:hypothetical protein G210_3011 [Candida maltosa Xu316]|uniref:Bul1 N-terminal domain-containing protein n=1 Tax=Candida maltosa (strain Xu316) TaxID=1245528 RepID=M3J446_CANMX|nr:hypothetical protein G210_3011 [Candida maltosa Xu316]